jgi:hypothetical protein
MFGEGSPGFLSALGSCVSAVVKLAHFALAAGGDVRSSIQISLGMEQVSLPSASETDSSQQDPRLAKAAGLSASALLHLLRYPPYNAQIP